MDQVSRNASETASGIFTFRSSSTQGGGLRVTPSQAPPVLTAPSPMRPAGWANMLVGCVGLKSGFTCQQDGLVDQLHLLTVAALAV